MTKTKTIRSDNGITVYTILDAKIVSAVAYGIDYGTVTVASAGWEAIDWHTGDVAERGQVLDI